MNPELIKQIEEVRQSSSTPGWDGYGAEPVRQEAVAQARRFLKVLPEQLHFPSLGAEADGCVTLEWYASPDWVLSVSVSADGQLVYAALFGGRKKSGTCVLGDAIPSTIGDLIKEFCSKDD